MLPAPSLTVQHGGSGGGGGGDGRLAAPGRGHRRCPYGGGRRVVGQRAGARIRLATEAHPQGLHLRPDPPEGEGYEGRALRGAEARVASPPPAPDASHPPFHSHSALSRRKTRGACNLPARFSLPAPTVNRGGMQGEDLLRRPSLPPSLRPPLPHQSQDRSGRGEWERACGLLSLLGASSFQASSFPPPPVLRNGSEPGHRITQAEQEPR